jgi:hypothetical protein
LRAWLVAATVAAAAALAGSVIATGAPGNTQRVASASPVSIQSLNGFSRLLTTTTTVAPARHIASIPPARPPLSYQRPAEFQAGYKPPHYLATTMAPITTTTVPPTTTVPITDSTSTNTGDWACIRWAESGDNYGEQIGLGGAYEIMPYVWQGTLGYSGYAFEYPSYVQDEAALRLYHMYGWQPWVADSYRCPFV